MIASYVGYALDSDVRYKATSGGVGTSILKYLFDHDIIQTSITFDYDNKTLQYYPRLINSYEEYKMTGSIYHEIKLIQFIKEHVAEIKGNFACFVLPCQARAIRSILDRNNVKSILIGLTCSSQQSIDATYYLLKQLHVDKDNVQYIQYRGNGWPSGIQIEMKNGIQKFVSNGNSFWTKIFHSRLFIQKRCFKCQDTLNVNSDITLADPWLDDFVSVEKEGKTIVAINSVMGDSIIKEMQSLKYIVLYPMDKALVIKSQFNTIKRKKAYKLYAKQFGFVNKIYSSALYKKLVLSCHTCFLLHYRIKTKIEYHFTKKIK